MATSDSAYGKLVNSMKKDILLPMSFSNFSFKKVIIGDWKSFFIFVTLMLLVYGYAHDTQECRALISDIDNVCTEYVVNKQANEVIPDDFNINITGGDTYRIPGP